MYGDDWFQIGHVKNAPGTCRPDEKKVKDMFLLVNVLIK